MKTHIITAAAILSAGMAYGAAHTDGQQMTGTVGNDAMDNLIRTRDITGGEIYTMNEAYDEGSWLEMESYTGIGDGWESIGEVEDIVLSRDGQMTGIVAEVGGFLDIGDAHVLIRLDDVKLVAVDDRSYAFVTRKSEEELEALPEVDEGWWN